MQRRVIRYDLQSPDKCQEVARQVMQGEKVHVVGLGWIQRLNPIHMNFDLTLTRERFSTATARNLTHDVLGVIRALNGMKTDHRDPHAHMRLSLEDSTIVFKE